MPKKKQVKRSLSGSDLAEVAQVFGRAEQLYPRLLAQRDHHAAELAKLDSALDRLRSVIGGKATAAGSGARKATSAPPAPTGKRRGRPPQEGSVSSIVLAALGAATAPLSASDLANAVAKKRKTSKANLQNALRDLRTKGLVKAAGKAKRFTYTLAKGGASPAAAPAKAAAPKKAGAKRGPKPGKRGPKGGGGPTIRDVVIDALKKSDNPPRAALIDAVAKAHPAAKPKSIAVTIDNLRREGLVKVTGKKRAFRYSLA